MNDDRATIDQLLREVLGMEESTTYMAILEKGESRGALRATRKNLLSLGGKRFGPPPTGTVAAIEAIDDLERLDQLILRLLDVGSWEELLSAPQPG